MRFTFSRFIKKILSPVYVSVTDLIAVNDLRHYDLPEEKAGNPFLIREIMPADLDKVRVDLGEATANRFQERFTSSRGYFALEGDMIVGWLWFTDQLRSKEGVPPFLYAVSPPKGAVYIFDMYTVLFARKRGVLKTLTRHLLAELKLAGITSAIFTYDHKNVAIKRMLQPRGFSTVGTLTYRRFFWWVKRDTSDLESICASS